MDGVAPFTSLKSAISVIAPKYGGSTGPLKVPVVGYGYVGGVNVVVVAIPTEVYLATVEILMSSKHPSQYP